MFDRPVCSPLDPSIFGDGQRRVRRRPFLSQEIEIDREGREWISRSKSVLGTNWSEHSKHAGFLHAMQLAPEILLCDDIFDLELRFQIADRRQQGQLDMRTAELSGGKSVQAELNGFSTRQFFLKLFLTGFARSKFAKIKTTLSSRLVIDHPELRKTDGRSFALIACENQVDAATDT